MPERETYRKVALVGGVCSGKTTLLDKYQQKKTLKATPTKAI